MSTDFKATWETYSASWKAPTEAQKRELFAASLDPSCQYTDPLTQRNGWDDLCAYMADFHKQVPGGHFVTTYFLAHNDRSIARWDMKNGDNDVVGHGISYGAYNDAGKLVEMTGFYDT